MKHLFGLVGAVILGIAAYIANYAYLANREGFTGYVQANVALVKDEDVYSQENVSEVLIAHNGPLPVNAVLWEDREFLLGSLVKRDLNAGELVTISEIGGRKEDLALESGETAVVLSVEGIQVEPGLLKVGRVVGFVVPKGRVSSTLDSETGTAPSRYEQLGPYRVVSVDDIIRVESESGVDDEVTTGLSTISIAVKLNSDGAFDEEVSRLIEAQRRQTIEAITLYRQDQSEALKESL